MRAVSAAAVADSVYMYLLCDDQYLIVTPLFPSLAFVSESDRRIYQTQQAAHQPRGQPSFQIKLES